MTREREESRACECSSNELENRMILVAPHRCHNTGCLGPRLGDTDVWRYGTSLPYSSWFIGIQLLSLYLSLCFCCFTIEANDITDEHNCQYSTSIHFYTLIHFYSLFLHLPLPLCSHSCTVLISCSRSAVASGSWSESVDQTACQCATTEGNGKRARQKILTSWQDSTEVDKNSILTGFSLR